MGRYPLYYYVIIHITDMSVTACHRSVVVVAVVVAVAVAVAALCFHVLQSR